MNSLSTYFHTAMERIGYFERAPTLSIAVSGGPDSMALLLLAEHWVKNRGGTLVALTVDHALRSESRAEAERVAAWCKSRNIRHHILTCTWDADVYIKSITQEQARDARYKLLADWCAAHCVLHLLTGHHAGDQAETLFFRLARGSGIDGLSAMPALFNYGTVRVIRPLLAISKTTLIHFLRAHDQAWICDPSNHNMRYARTQLRALLSPEITQRAGLLVQDFAAARNRHEENTARALAKCAIIFPAGYGFLVKESWLKLAPDYAYRALAAIVQTISGAHHPPRTEKLERLSSAMRNGDMLKHTISGCIITFQPKKNRFLIYREARAIEPPFLLPPQKIKIWDSRFTVSHSSSQAFCVRFLGPDGKKQLAAQGITLTLPHSLALTLPSFWYLEELAAVPHMRYTNPKFSGDTYALFHPPKALAAAAFFRFNAPLTQASGSYVELR